MSKTKKKLNEAELSAFCRQIAMVLNAGLPIYYGISVLMDDTDDPDTKAIYEELYRPMEAGSNLNSALKGSGIFPAYMVQMVELGEETGRLEHVLNSLSDYYDREAEIKSGVRHAALYPLIMTIMMIVVIIVLMTKVLPVFSQIYEELGSELTGVARTLLNISTGLNRYLGIFVGIFALLLIAAVILYHTGIGRIFLQRGKLHSSIASSRFANCMYLALASGLDTDRGLDLAAELVNNPHMQEKVLRCKEHIKHGMNFEDAIRKAGIFSKVYSSWIAIGYRTGDMESVMKRICEAYEDETDERISNLISTIEPTLVIILCFFVGLILISFLLPLLGIMQSIG